MRSLGALAFVVACVLAPACGGTSRNDGTANGSSTPASACDRYQGAHSLTDVCAALGSCPRTLRGYLGTGHVAPQNYARVGCGLTEIRDVDSGADTTSTYAFDDSGALVGVDRVALSDDGGPCGMGEYSYGALLDACDSVRECHIPKNAGDTGDVCGCECPDPPPDDGLFVTTSDCVYPANPISDCEPALSGELTRYGDAGLTLRYGCGFVVAGDPDALECSYDASGALAGASRADPTSMFCGGVTQLQTGEPYVSCHAEQTCRWGGAGADSDATPCGDTPPDAGGSGACSAWQNEKDLATSCAMLTDCPADEQSYLAGLSDPSAITAVIGCGLTEYGPSGGGPLGGQAFVFDAAGNLVGYDMWNDVSWGPCGGEDFNEYQRGASFLACDVVKSCGLRDDFTPECE